MIAEAKDFEQECDALAAILGDATEDDFKRVTLFENWTLEDVIGHLHIWNHAATLTLDSREKFTEFFQYIIGNYGDSGSSLPVQYKYIDTFQDGLRGKALFEAWRAYYPQMAHAYYNSPEDTRVAWAGPDMSAQSKIIARQMETWAHGQEIFDVLGLEREDKDRIRNIAHLGVTTYSWSFKVKGETPPLPKPYVKLTAPSGVIWEWNDPQEENMVCGSATEFCQVVTQTRNIDDTEIMTTGPNAREWMKKAQCFAGTPKMPPPKGYRRKA